MNNKIIVTSASNRFFPWLLNFIGSIQKNYPEHKKIIVYSLGLNKLFLNELKNIQNVEIKKIPKVVKYWKKDFTWKLLMYEDLLNIKDSLILYIDSGATIIKSLDSIFKKIDKNGYFFIGAIRTNFLTKIIPKDYINKFNIKIINIKDKSPIAAGFTGLNTKNKIINDIFYKSSELAKKGYCIGSSINERGNKNTIRDCDFFRHDQTILSMIIFSKINKPVIHKMIKYGGTTIFHKGQYVHLHRRNLKTLPYLNLIQYNNLNINSKIIIGINRLLIKFYFKIEKILVFISKILNKII